VQASGKSDEYQRWQQQDLESYEFVYSQQRGDVIVDTAEVFVGSEEIDAIVMPLEVSEEGLLVETVDSFFMTIGECIRRMRASL
jgi:hypothetical protein